MVLVLAPVHPASGAGEVTGILRLATNYDYRGYTRSDNDPTVQLNGDIAWDNGLFLGTWVSSVDLGSAGIEANPYLGGVLHLSPDWQLVTSLAGYFYDGRIRHEDIDYGEGSVQIHFRDSASLAFNLAPDYYGSGHSVLDYEFELRHPITDTVEAVAGLGYQAARKALNYDNLYWNAGIAWYPRPWLTLDLRYQDMHEMNARRYDRGYTYSHPDYEIDTSIILSLSIGF